MANVIALAEKYQALLDDVYKQASKTAILDTPASQLDFTGAKTVNIFEMEMDGLAKYDRNNGFVKGSVNGSWKDYELTQDRGTSFSVDAMDNEETLGLAFGKLAGEFERLMVVPEIDAYRFAKYATVAGTKVNAAVTPGTTDCADLVDAADAEMTDNEVPMDGRILFVSEVFYRGLKKNITRVLANENGVQREVEVFDNKRIIRVPKERFNTAVTLNDGSSAFGFTPATGSYGINFLLIHPSAVAQVVKHVKPRIFTPDQNQDADAWKFDYRMYHDAFAYDKKVKGIYLHRNNTAKS